MKITCLAPMNSPSSQTMVTGKEELASSKSIFLTGLFRVIWEGGNAEESLSSRSDRGTLRQTVASPMILRSEKARTES